MSFKINRGIDFHGFITFFFFFFLILAGNLSFAQIPPSDINQKKFPPRSHIIVVGAGPAGLYSAYLLQQAGYRVTVLEAQKRVGGRVYTDWGMKGRNSKGPFYPYYVELGATRIPDTHHRVLNLIKNLGLELDEFSNTSTQSLYSLQDLLFLESVGPTKEMWEKLPLTEEEKSLGFKALKTNYTTRALKKFEQEKISLNEILEFLQQQKTYDQLPLLKEFGQKTYQDYFISQGASAGAIQLLKALNGSEIDEYSSLIFLYQELHDQAWDKTYKVRGGNQLIWEILSQKLHSPPLLNSPVTSVQLLSAENNENHKSAVLVQYESDKGNKSIKGDFVFFTISPHALKKIHFLNALSAEKKSMIEDEKIKMQDVARINLKTKTRFWSRPPYELKGLTLAYTDSTIERVWDMTATQQPSLSGEYLDKGGVLTLYIQAGNAKKICQMKTADYRHTIMVELNKIFPSIREEVTAINRWCWQDDTYQGGGWAVYHPQNLHLLQEWWKSEGNERIYFLGDHTSAMVGWIEGALESVERVLN